MVSSDEERTRQRQEQASLAVSLAMQGKWREAVEINQSMIAQFPFDVEAYNRLGRALFELGEYTGAREAYGHALATAPYNAIARRNLGKLAHLGERPHILKGDHHRFAPELFVKESGKAGVVNVRGLVSTAVLSELTTGEEVYLRVVDNWLLVYNGEGEYLGRIEPKHEARLVRLMEGGNQYAAAVSSLGENQLEIIVREIYQDPSQTGHSSFKPEEIGFNASARNSMLQYEIEEEQLNLEEDEYRDQPEELMEDLGFHEVSSGG